MNKERRVNQSGGVNITGGTVTARDIVGHDKIGNSEVSYSQLDQILLPVADAVAAAPPDRKAEATQKLQDLKTEATKAAPNDTVIARLLDGLVKLVPGAVSAIVGAFGNPILAGISGPTTKFVLDQISGK